jgi:hypothetical protein
LKQEREAERGRMQNDIDPLRQERDAERIRAAQVDALRATLELERQRVDEWKAVADRWALQAEELTRSRRWSWWRRAS